MNSATFNDHRVVRTTELIAWVVVTLVAGFFVPGLGIAIGVVLAFTRLRHTRPTHRWSLVAVGTVLLIVQIVGLAAGDGDTDVSPTSVVS